MHRRVTRFSQQVSQNPIRRLTTASLRTCWAARGCCNWWSPTSRMRSNKALRQAIAVALQGDRTSDSIVPTGVEGHTAAFPLGGKAKPKVTWKSRIKLTLGYDASMPNGQTLRPRSGPVGEHGRTERAAQARSDGCGPESCGPEGLDGNSPGVAAAISRCAARPPPTVRTIETEFQATTDVAGRIGCWQRYRSRRPWI